MAREEREERRKRREATRAQRNEQAEREQYQQEDLRKRFGAAVASREDIAPLARELTSAVGIKGAVRQLPDALRPGERVQQLLEGAAGVVSHGVVVLTTHRLVYVEDAYGTAQVKELDRAQITSVDWSKRTGFWSRLIAHTVAGSLKLQVTNMEAGEALAEALRKTPSQASGRAPGSTGVLAQIQKLGELRDAGLVTEEEFTTKKAELLSRL